MSSQDCERIQLQEWWRKLLTQVGTAEYDRFIYDQRGKLSFNVIYRPARGPHGRVLETNPHFRSDVWVCKGHTVVVYAALYPFEKMPDIVNGSEADAVAILDCKDEGAGKRGCREIIHVTRCDPVTATKRPDGQDTVKWQWPAEHDLIRVSTGARRIRDFPVGPQTAMLELNCKGREPPPREPCLQGQQCAEPCKPCEVQCPAGVSCRPPPETSDPTTVAVGVAAAALGGAGLAMYLQRRGSVPPPAPPQSTARVLVRSRPDIPGASLDESNNGEDL